jgi:hypothetical protein
MEIWMQFGPNCPHKFDAMSGRIKIDNYKYRAVRGEFEGELLRLRIVFC